MNKAKQNILHQKLLRAAARIQRMDLWHILVAKSQEVLKEIINHLRLRAGQKKRSFINPERYSTILQTSIQNVPTAVEFGRLFYPKLDRSYQSATLYKQSEDTLAKHWIENSPADTLCAYSDGSSCGLAKSAWGYILFRGRQMIGSGAGPLLGAEAYDGELLGA